MAFGLAVGVVADGVLGLVSSGIGQEDADPGPRPELGACRCLEFRCRGAQTEPLEHAVR